MIKKNPARLAAARNAAHELRERLDLGDRKFPVGIILGTGWGDALRPERSKRLPLGELSDGFAHLPALAGHAREAVCGKIDGVNAVMLRGRVHLYESPLDRNVFDLVRLQTEMLIHLGAKTLILTCSAGTLAPREVKAGDIMVIDGFMSLFAPWLPGYAEFGSPEDAIDHDLLTAARGRHSRRTGTPLARRGGYAMVPGSFYEGRKYDKPFLAMTGAKAVGMSMLPEAATASLYRHADPAKDVRIAPVAYITNDDVEEHSHEMVVGRAKSASADLGEFIRSIIACIPADRK